MRMPQTETGYCSQYAHDDHTCTVCGADAGDTDNNGVIVHGGYGSTRYDETRLIWLVRGEEVAKPGMLCDDCIDGFVAEGKLEAFAASIASLPEGTPSEAAYRELFAHGARRVYSAYWEEMGEAPYARRSLDDAGRESIERLRRMMVGDGDIYNIAQLERAKEARRAMDVGEAHAMAAISLGFGEEDPGFEEAAATWAAERMARANDFRETWELFRSLGAVQDPRPKPAADGEQTSDATGEAE